ncbi:MAG TPA: dTDP-4-dehydrorhamnose reductase [Daejeonella sp.]|nr:dTDP-4-dehydrorhamnose reductase [Daejeonella sp.]
MSKTIIFGASGQLGQCLRTVAGDRDIQGIIFPEEAVADILRPDLLTELFEREKPDYVINCAAYTAVDKAEDELDLARRINKDGAANLARLCKSYNTVLIHVSTDFVFAGDSVVLLTESDPAQPVNVYGLTKLEGENAIANAMDNFFILRTSWLYSEYGNNFVKTMLNLGQARTHLNVVADQIGTPTYAIDLASCILHIIEEKSAAYGIYHYSNEGVTSWYDFAKAIFDISEISVVVSPVASNEYLTKAQRPAFSVMDKSKIKSALKIEIPYWRESLEACILNINRNKSEE